MTEFFIWEEGSHVAAGHLAAAAIRISSRVQASERTKGTVTNYIEYIFSKLLVCNLQFIQHQRLVTQVVETLKKLCEFSTVCADRADLGRTENSTKVEFLHI